MLADFMLAGPSERESGQAAVESALVLPVLILLTLGILQLAMLQQARLMTDYAAFQAARAGVVWNGSNERMNDAAFVSVLPTLGATNTLENLAKTYARAKFTDAALSKLPFSGPTKINGQPMKGLIRVDTISPANYAELSTIWNLRGKGAWEEIDFDAADTYSEGLPELSDRFQKFDSPAFATPDQDFLRRVNVLTIRVRYWYELRIPFANWFVFLSWFAANADVLLHGALDRPTMLNENVAGSDTNVDLLPALVKGISHERGLPTATRADLSVLWGLSTGLVPLPLGLTDWGGGRRFFIPVTATYSMRMQSNFHRKWLVHEAPSWTP